MAKLVITYPRKPRGRKRKQEKLPNTGNRVTRVCQFCMNDEDNEVKFGAIFEKEDITVHYFCMLLSSGLCQNTRVSDQKSLLGFVLSDIKKELQRGNRLKCCYCHNKGATIGCCVRSCRKVFHLNCGRQYGTMHQFFDSFRSYCENHRIEQEFSTEISHQRSRIKKICSICLCAVGPFASCDTLIPPCCQKSSFHRHCLQQYALSAGMHYFKCPLCNSVQDFQAEMQTFGIYIPDQDASWEREPNAFHELLERHNSCDVSECLCPHGRLFDANSGQFELLLCGCCGSYGSHKACHGLVWRGIHKVCCDCADILDRGKQKQRESNHLTELERQPTEMRLLRPRSGLLQQAHNAQSSTSSTPLALLNGSSREHTLQHNLNSPVPRRNRHDMNQGKTPACVASNKQKQRRLHANSRRSNTTVGTLQQLEFPGPSTSSATLALLNGSPREHTLQHNLKSPGPRRNRYGMNQGKTPACVARDRQKQRRLHANSRRNIHANSRRKNTTVGSLQQLEFPGPSTGRYNQVSLHEEEGCHQLIRRSTDLE